VAEASLSTKSLAILFLAVAAFFSTAGWLRPPLSSDISGLHLSLGLLDTAAQPSETLLPRSRSMHSSPEELSWCCGGPVASP
jgi:hypothetical protein